MSAEADERQDKPLFGGLVLIALGSLFLLDRFDVVEFWALFRRLWPLIIIGSGLWKFLGGDVWNGSWLFIIGLWLQVSHIRLFGLRYGTSWPLLLIALGLHTIVRALFASRESGASRET